MSLNRPALTKDRLREAMLRANKKQIDLVRETGLNRGTISRYLSGEVEPKSDAINRLAISLGCSEMWLWGYDVPMERKKKNSPSESDLTEWEQMWLELYRRTSEDTRDLLVNMMASFDRIPQDQQRLVLQMIRAALGNQK